MDVFGFFEKFFNGLGGVLEFLNTPFKMYLPTSFNLSNQQLMVTSVDVTPLTAFGVSCGAFLVVAFFLHLWHLVKLVF